MAVVLCFAFSCVERIRKVCCVKLKRPIDCTVTVRFKIKRKQEIIQIT